MSTSNPERSAPSQPRSTGQVGAATGRTKPTRWTQKRFEKILRAGWRAFDKAVKSARGKTLTTGPRGGGRSLEGIVAHVIAADAGYLTSVSWRASKAVKPQAQLTATREAILAALKASATGEIPERGPRGGARWSARYFVRRVAWHVIAHTWEIERRAAPSRR